MTNLPNWTEVCKARFAIAYNEALVRGDREVTPEYILLSLLFGYDWSGAETQAVCVLKCLNVPMDSFVDALMELLPEPPPDSEIEEATDPRPKYIPFAEECKPLVEGVEEEAALLNDSLLGTEHLLLGLIRQTESRAGQLLASFDVTRADALQAIGDLRAQGVSESLSIAEEEESKDAALNRAVQLIQTTGKRKLAGLSAPLLLTLLLADLALMIVCLGRRDSPELAMTAITLLGFCILLFFLMLMSLPERFAARRLIEAEDSRAVPGLIRILRWHNRALHRDATLALVRLLPQMDPHAVEMLPIEERLTLYAQLTLENAYQRPVYTQALLSIPERISDAKALPYVQRLLAVLGPEESVAAVRNSAQRCLETLQMHNRRQHASRPLLRSAESGSDSPETLLRATTEPADFDSDSLLRPVADNEDTPR